MPTRMQLSSMMIVVTALLSLSIADRCREICEKVNYEDQCGTCRNRPPIRFGKRSSPEINVHVQGVAIPQPPPGLLTLLQRAAALDTADMAETHLPQYAADTGDSTLRFQQDYQ